jgi:hypothetical protein
LRIKRLIHGGIMVNYCCNAACRHCLYASSPSRRSGYITKEKIIEICHTLVSGRIGSVHIGGGEPFLDFQSLVMVIREAAKAGITLDYVETNAFWAHDPSCGEYLAILMQEEVRALCISVDPFHVEYIPWEYPVSLARFCEKQGMGYFLWKQEFLKTLSPLDSKKLHPRQAIEAVSPDYLEKTAAVYGIRVGGRAINIEEEYGYFKPVAGILDDFPCNDLLSSAHFHVDLEGFFIPPGCTGLRLPLEEALSGIEHDKYPIFQALYSGGISSLYQISLDHGFSPDEKGYPSKCNLCFHIRSFLAPQGFAELDPDFYIESLKYY